MIPELTNSAAEAMGEGLDAIGGVFTNLTQLISDNWFIAALFIIPLAGIGIAIFKKIVRKFSR